MRLTPEQLAEATIGMSVRPARALRWLAADNATSHAETEQEEKQPDLRVVSGFLEWARYLRTVDEAELLKQPWPLLRPQNVTVEAPLDVQYLTHHAVLLALHDALPEVTLSIDGLKEARMHAASMHRTLKQAHRKKGDSVQLNQGYGDVFYALLATGVRQKLRELGVFPIDGRQDRQSLAVRELLVDTPQALFSKLKMVWALCQ